MVKISREKVNVVWRHNKNDISTLQGKLSADTFGKFKSGHISGQQKEGSITKRIPKILQKREAVPPIESDPFFFNALCLCNTFCPSLFYLPHLLPSYPSFFSKSLHLGSSSWQPLNLCKSEGAGRIGVTMACASSLICLDHGYGAYLDNKTACQHLPSHTLPHAKQPCIWE